ncbi:MAG: BatD family protein [Epsilonproteobacteria bacterium]|nr:BatD family protein [Campylobacterota bacterium]
MKKNLGKIVLFLLLANSLLLANNLATFTLKANKTTAYIKEAVLINFTAKQKDHTNVMFFFLKPKKSDAYEIKLLSKKTTELSYHNFTTTFTYVLFPLKATTLHVDFDFTIKEASDEAVAQVYTGSRDNVKWIETQDTQVKIEPLIIHAKALKQAVDLVGDFTLNAKINKTKIDQYESVNLLYTLKGEGYRDKNFNILDKIDGVAIFSEINDAYSKLTKKGYVIQREFIYALSAQKNFTVPKREFLAYSPTKQKYYTLATPQYDIEVEPIDTATLLDAVESPQNKHIIEFEELKQFFIYILIFFSGFIAAKYLPNSLQLRSKEKKFEDIHNAKTAKELLGVITKNYSLSIFENEIKELESLVYKKEKNYNFKKIKSDILKKLK